MAERTDQDRRYGISRYPYEPGTSGPRLQWGSLKIMTECFLGTWGDPAMSYAVHTYEFKYINAALCQSLFHRSEIALRQEILKSKNEREAFRYGLCAIITVRYLLRVTSLLTEFYRMSTVDPANAKVIPVLERRGWTLVADVLAEPLSKLKTYITVQIIKAVTTLSASNMAKGSFGDPANGL